ncbi:glycosyltransferase family 2 protein [Paraburkholderia sp. UYCP14C]|uniref:glycosyltransferase family 2 protein n=1 Tax=Paraburkholderia sp. UYCP14C TaxID=2511130 RepID=UPI00101ECC5E|nr:glycosyltransferase family 2 protein [Paraburkholderia sp. UYCP14C]RZF26351.1 glycosyltransferase family 2 protein [Paraburkholderia sp. UYCP14C]
MQRQATHPRISIVVLTYNRAGELLTTLERLLALPENPPIIIADNGSTDNTVTLVQARFPGVRVVECKGNLGAAGRNHALACVETDYVAFCDDDTWWEPGSLECAVQLLDGWPCVGVLNARVAVGADNATDPTCTLMRASPLGRAGLPGPSLIGYMAGACVFRTALFRDVGGYEPHLFIGGEEALVSLDVLAAGHAIVYCEQLTLHHHPSPVRDSALRARMLARNAAWVAWLRLPLGEALRATLRALDVFAREGALVRDGINLLAGLAWTAPRRRVVPRSILGLRARVHAAERNLDASATTTVGKFDAPS